MKKPNINKLGLIILISTILFSCTNSEKKIYGFNGIYRTHPDGKEFKLNGDSAKTIKIDTIPIIVPYDFDKVRMEFSASTNEPVLSIQLTEVGIVKFAKLTRENIGKPLAIILNDKLLSMPVVRSEMRNGNIVVSGLDMEMIENLANEFEK